MKAVIMAGGRGTRIAALAGDLPKPMLPIDGRPVLERELGSLQEQGVTDVLITVGHLAPAIMEYFGNGSGCSPQTGRPVCGEHPLPLPKYSMMAGARCPTVMSTSVTPCSCRDPSSRSSTGRPSMGSIGLGRSPASAAMRVPRPPAMITAFIMPAPPRAHSR